MGLGDAGEERRREPEAVVGQLAGRRPAAGTLLLADVGQLADLGQLLSGVDRTDVGVLVERIADPQGGHPALEPCQHVVRDALLHEQARAGAADVTLVEEDAVDDALDSLVERGVVEDDVRGLAAELEGDPLVGAGHGLGDRASHLGRAGERHLVDVRVGDQRAAGVAAPVTMFTTPAGRSACWQISANSSAVSGVVSAGFSTTVLPQASAGAIFQASISSGKFHGMTWAATPRTLGARRSPQYSSSSAQPA